MRGGIEVDLVWSGGKLVRAEFTVAGADGMWNEKGREVRVVYEGKVVGEFSTMAGMKKVFSFV